MPGSILAAVTPDNTPGGAVLTFAFPLGLFIVVAVILYLRFARPHRRVPEALGPAQAGPAGGVRTAVADNGTGGSAADAGPGNVSGQESAPAGGDDGEPGPANGGKASE